MGTIGLDQHKRESQLCIGHDDDTVEERRIVTSRERFATVLGERVPARMLLEGRHTEGVERVVRPRRLGIVRVSIEAAVRVFNLAELSDRAAGSARQDEP
jgi:hypothetical protein